MLMGGGSFSNPSSNILLVMRNFAILAWMFSALWAILYNLDDPLLASKSFWGCSPAGCGPESTTINNPYGTQIMQLKMKPDSLETVTTAVQISRLFQDEMEGTFLFTLHFMSRLFMLIPISVDFQRYTLTNLTPASYCEHILLLFHRGITRRHDWHALAKRWTKRHTLVYLSLLSMWLRCHSPSVICTYRYVSVVVKPSSMNHTTVSGGGLRPFFDPCNVMPYVLEGSLLWETDKLVYDRHELQMNSLIAEDDKVYARVPLKDLAPHLKRAELTVLANLHGIKTLYRSNVAVIREDLASHVCTACQHHVSVFSVTRNYRSHVAKKPKQAPKKHPKASAALKSNRQKRQKLRDQRKKTRLSENNTQEAVFPPLPPDKALRSKIIAGFCKDMDPAVFEEAGCCVCGQLTPLSELTLNSDVAFDWSLLEKNGVTRRERHSLAEAVTELDGPILADGCQHTCVDCEEKLLKKIVPTHSLANNNWIGNVPAALQGLTFAEQMMIARVRHSRCVVRVASGRGKLTANAVMFATPIAKVYSVLPPTEDQLSEILAFVFLGSSKPTDEDYIRTPMLVRRSRVQAALDWLKLNHEDYGDLQISAENLSKLPDHGIPCGVDWKETEAGASNRVAEAMGVHDDGEEDGTESGMCPFAVACLSGEQFEDMDLLTLKAKALDHLKRGGKSLGIGRAEEPESLFHNPQLYPKMFPWLFPYGRGGISQPEHKKKISEEVRKKKLLLFHDKRFQVDFYFPLIAFNDSQIKGASSSSYLLVKRKNMDRVAEKVNKLNSAVLKDLSERMEGGEKVKPESDAEKACFTLLEELEFVGSKVNGSLTSKKFRRNEVWSLISFKGAPSWFTTYSPVDTKHPICLYFADGQIKFSPELKLSDERLRLIARNPVAAARFFHYMSMAFIKHVLGVGTDHVGLYGNTDAYYGTVEQQGRLTLHMHMLLWIKSALSPQEIRDRIMRDDGQFQKSLLAYLEGCHVGDFLTGSLSDVEKKIKSKLGNHRNNSQSQPYLDPTQTLPEAPPPACDNCSEASCANCARVNEWWERHTETVDDLMFRSNVHTCRRPVAGTDLSKPLKRGSKMRNEIRGCLRKDGTCSARFPREIKTETRIDPEDGSISLRKLEEWINTVTPDLTYCLRCNTDVTSLLSGTAIKAVVAYISDYITKSSLKLYHIFDSVRDILNRKTTYLGSSHSKENSRLLIQRMVNNLTSKLQIGSPLACLYLLGHPDHYTNMKFKTFPWKSYVSKVLSDFSVPSMVVLEEGDASPLEPGDTALLRNSEDIIVASDIHGTDNTGDDTKAVLFKADGCVVGATAVDDYVHRHESLSNLCLYDYFQIATRKKRTASMTEDFLTSLTDQEAGEKDADNMDVDVENWLDEDVTYEGSSPLDTSDPLSTHAFLPSHPLFQSHYIQCDMRNMADTVPNFVFGTLPRKDQGDREYYCCTMLTLFKPWRTGQDLKGNIDSWSEMFEDHEFTARAQRLMGNFHVRYECNDARDDFNAQDKRNRAKLARDTPAAFNVFDESDVDSDSDDDSDEWAKSTQPHYIHAKGPKHMAKELLMKQTENMMENAGWTSRHHVEGPQLQPYLPKVRLTGNQWASVVNETLNARLKEKYKKAPANRPQPGLKETKGPDAVKIVGAHYFTKEFEAKSKKDQQQIEDTVVSYALNREQERAFRLIANHSVSDAPDQLKMYLGGMGGTGKTQVIKALCHFFESRDEGYRFVVLGPTGTSSALLGGSTYHMFLGINDNTDGEGFENLNINQVRERLRGVDYIFIDEVSMLSCSALYKISAKLAMALNEHERAFGGLNMIFAGDFGQLPPVRAKPLWNPDTDVATTVNTKMTLSDQQNTVGKILWLGVTTVVILKENMRQRKSSAEDDKLRTALGNMRYGACTEDDIVFLRSRTISRRPGHPTFEKGDFRNVPTITGLNAVKDQINNMGCIKFAEETGQPLIDFFSNDTVPDNSSTDKRKRKPIRKRKETTITEKLSLAWQNILWSAPPASTDNIPGKLSLCVGMPVVIRNNNATELCITKGQEAAVVGWQEALGNSEQRVLDTLFVELIDPPKRVEIPGLDPNIVPINAKKETIWWNMPDDAVMKICRKRVLVHLNFAGTDYSFQGRSKPLNVVDAHNLRSHFAYYYVALSRGTTASGTVILQGIDAAKITKGISGYLRQEFRELEILNKITALRFEGLLPDTVQGINRRHLLQSYKTYMGGQIEPEDLHAAIRGNGTTYYSNREIGNWQLLGKRGRKRKLDEAGHGGNESEASGKGNNPPRNTGNDSQSTGNGCSPPIGMIWNSRDHSCAYDSLFTPLYDVWRSDDVVWSNRFDSMNRYLTILNDGFGNFKDGKSSLESARDQTRVALRSDFPELFPTGPVTTILDNVTSKVLGNTAYGTLEKKCTTCDHSYSTKPSFYGVQSILPDDNLRGRFKTHYGVSQWLTAQKVRVSLRSCRKCGNKLKELTRLHTLPHLMYFSVDERHIILDRTVNLRLGSTQREYRLCGVIYAGQLHFTARIIRANGDVWYYDGIETGGFPVREGNIRDKSSRYLNSCVRKSCTRTVAGIVYIQVDA